MRFKVIGENDLVDPISQICKNREVDNYKELLNISKESCHSPLLLDNMDTVVIKMKEALKEQKKLHIIVDSDMDGITSASMLYLYLKQMGFKNITWNVHAKKIHGIFMEELEEFDFDILLVPDAGTNDLKNHALLSEMGKTVICLDHHEQEKITTNAIIVNPKACDYPNKEISGAIVVHKFCEAMDKATGNSFADYYLDLVAIGAIADMMDTRVPETRYYCIEGLKKLNNPMLKALYEGGKFSIGNTLNIEGVQFYIAPLVNAVFRIGTKEEISLMFQNFIDTEQTMEDYKKRSVGLIKVPMQENFYRKMGSIKRSQAKLKESILEKAHALESFSLEDKILMLTFSKEDDAEILGLIANDLANRYKRPILIMSEKSNGEYRGSARNYSKFEVKELKSFLSDMPFNLLAGHENAFGVGCKAEKLEEIKKEIKEKTKDVEMEDMFFVDLSMDCGLMNTQFIKMLDRFSALWGIGLTAPLFHVYNVQAEDIVVNEKQTMISFKSNAVDYVIFRPTEEDIENLVGKNAELQVVGQAKMNRWLGEEKPQFIVDNYTVVCYNESKSFWF